jgi:hypothetical protein
LAVVACAASGVVAVPAGPAHADPNFWTESSLTLNFGTNFVGDPPLGRPIHFLTGSNPPPTAVVTGGEPVDQQNFSLNYHTCAGKTFMPNSVACEFDWLFHPTSYGDFSTTATIAFDDEVFTVTLIGRGTSCCAIQPTSLAFPDTAVGETSALDVEIDQVSMMAQTPDLSGGAPLDQANFGYSQNCTGALLGSCEFTYEFHPTGAGTWSTTATIHIDGYNAEISMSGTATDITATTTTTAEPNTTTTTPATPTTAPAPTTAATTTEPAAPPAAAATTPATSAPSTTAAFEFAVVAGPLSGDVEGHGEVIAQGVVAFPDGTLLWDHRPLDSVDLPFTFTDTPAMFLASAGSDPLLLRVGDNMTTLALLDPGEATFVPAGDTGELELPAAVDVATAHRITFVAGTGVDSFTPGAGNRDVNLVRAELAPGETLHVTSPFPVFVVVTAGTVVDTTDTSELGTGSATVRDPNVELNNSGGTTATVLVATIGGQVP